MENEAQNNANETATISFSGFRDKVLIVICNQDDNSQFVRQLHQPFFYKEIDPHNWILNTYQTGIDESKRFNEYACRKFDPESIPGWKEIAGDKYQIPFDF